ncbi:hypothetical protein [Enterococcus saccharolyticus]|uniref:hypothetical protein n=1 Tax=Enterococcus saccharolyticus TaxID=41997 RepID=UPI0039E121D1
MSRANALRKQEKEIVIGDITDELIEICQENNELYVQQEYQQKIVIKLETLLANEQNLLALREKIQQLDQAYLLDNWQMMNHVLPAEIYRVVQHNNKQMLDNEALTSEALQSVVRIVHLVSEYGKIPNVTPLYQLLKQQYPRTTLLCGYLTEGISNELKAITQSLLAVMLLE